MSKTGAKHITKRETRKPTIAELEIAVRAAIAAEDAAWRETERVYTILGADPEWGEPDKWFRRVTANLDTKDPAFAKYSALAQQWRAIIDERHGYDEAYKASEKASEELARALRRLFAAPARSALDIEAKSRIAQLARERDTNSDSDACWIWDAQELFYANLAADLRRIAGKVSA